MQIQLNAVLEKHCQTIKSNVVTLGEMLNEIASSVAVDPRNAVEEAEGLAHQLKGSSGTAGFRDISQAATALDDHLKLLCGHGEPKLEDGISEAMHLYQSLEAFARAATPQTSSLYRTT